MNIVTEQM